MVDAAEFKAFGKEMIDFVANYMETVRERPVFPAVKPGFLKELIPSEAPKDPECWQDIMSDLETVVMPGMTHWQSPNFHAYFAISNSYPSIVADILTNGLGGLALSWISSPVFTELEINMMDWLGKMLDLPKEFLSCSGGKGGGVIQGSGSEAILISLLSAKARAIRWNKDKYPDMSETDISNKLVGYSSTQSHSSVERAGLLVGTLIRLLPTDAANKFRSDSLEKAIKEDLEAGLLPFYVVATLGTTASCAFDNLEEIGPVCNEHGLWLHVDAAYAGSAFVCPEYRYLMKGIERADSFDFNVHKWLLVNFECTAMWLKDPSWMINSFRVDPVYLKNNYETLAPDFRHWQIATSRKCRALKLWFVLRLYGINNIQNHIRKQIGLAHYFENLMKTDDRFEIMQEVLMGLVCFRLKDCSNEINEKLLEKINKRGGIYIIPSKINDLFILRIAICSRFTENKDMDFTWSEVKEAANEILKEDKIVQNGFTH